MSIEYAASTPERKRRQAGAIRKWRYMTDVCKEAGIPLPEFGDVPDIERALPPVAKVATQYALDMDGAKTVEERIAIKERYKPKRVAEPTNEEVMERQRARIAEKARLLSR